jgi:hypothetical protein
LPPSNNAQQAGSGAIVCYPLMVDGYGKIVRVNAVAWKTEKADKAISWEVRQRRRDGVPPVRGLCLYQKNASFGCLGSEIVLLFASRRCGTGLVCIANIEGRKGVVESYDKKHDNIFHPACRRKPSDQTSLKCVPTMASSYAEKRKSVVLLQEMCRGR